MTALRSLALKISAAVVRYASPGCKEWAQGLAREVAFVEGDWAALGWAVGSMRVLLERRPGFLELGSAFTAVFSVGLPCLEIFGATCLSERVGWSLVLFGSAYWNVARLRDWLVERSAPPDDDKRARAIFGRGKLERRLRRARSIWRWAGPAVTTCYCVGMVLALHSIPTGPIFCFVVIAGGLFAIRLQVMDSPTRIQGQIQRWDAFVADHGWLEGDR
jgi:hypothetical protein